MKCVLCQYKSELNDLKQHYINEHNVDENNGFFKKLISQNENVFYWETCNYCNEFVLRKHEHNFLKHYGRGFTDQNDDDIPVINTRVGGICKLEITFEKHASDYDFFDPEAVVDRFLTNVKRLIQRYDNDVLIRAGFSIENIQQPLDNYSEPLLQTRYWSTEPLQSKSFNDFIEIKIRESILKRVVNNNLSGSAWHFNKFIYLNIKILNVTAAAQLVR